MRVPRLPAASRQREGRPARPPETTLQAPLCAPSPTCQCKNEWLLSRALALCQMCLPQTCLGYTRASPDCGGCNARQMKCRPNAAQPPVWKGHNGCHPAGKQPSNMLGCIQGCPQQTTLGLGGKPM